MLLIVLSFFLGGCWAEKRKYLQKHPVLPSVLALFGLFLLGTMWSIGATEDIAHGLSDQSKLLYFPILLWFIKDEAVAQKVMWAVIFAMLITYFLGFLKYYYDLPIGIKYSEAAVFKNHIKTNFFMAFATYLTLYEAYHKPKFRLYLILVAAAMLHYAYFMSLGRTGYILMLLLVGLFAFQHFRFKGLLIAILLISGLVGLSWSLSETFHERVSDFSCEMLDDPSSHPKCVHSEIVVSKFPTSISFRRDFIITSWHAIKQQFWLGYGPGSFSKAYENSAEQLSTYLTDNPHNEYLHVWVELGFVGLLFFGYFFFAQLRALSRYPIENRRIAEAVLLGFMVGCLANSWLLDFSEIHFWMLMLALASRRYRVNV